MAFDFSDLGSSLSAHGPTYGNYGGADYSGGVHLQPGQEPDYSVQPIDELDTLFRTHDMSSEASGSYDRAVGDLNLIIGIEKLSDTQLTPEGHLYAGVATLAMLADIALGQGHPEVLTPSIVATATESALENIAAGGGAQIHAADGFFFL
jgi:hypothetical protein